MRMIPVGITCVYDEEQGIARIGQDYIQAVEKAGGIPIPVVTRDEKVLKRVFAMIRALVLSGGGDLDPGIFGEGPVPGLGAISPSRDFVEIQLAAMALDMRLPVMGICRGIQVLNAAAGGTLYQDLGEIKGKKAGAFSKSPAFPPLSFR